MRPVILSLALAFATACAQTPASAPTSQTATSPGATVAPGPTSSPAATVAGATALACTAPAQPLVTMTEGPYYKAGAPQTSNLRAAGVAGTPLILTGHVVTRSCQPIANAKIDFWQADGNGNYDNSGYTLRGYLMTDANGAYRLETVIPGLYPGRTEHIHFKVTANGQTWTSQLFFPDSTGNARDSIYSEQMLIKLDKSTTPVSGTFTFVVNVA